MDSAILADDVRYLEIFDPAKDATEMGCVTNNLAPKSVKDRKLIEAAIDEGLRWRPTDPVFPQLTTCDVEVHDQKIPAVTQNDVYFRTAKRDPARWQWADECDIYRKAQYHLGVGVGSHQCLGQYIARQEMVTALNRLMDRFHNMRVDPNAPEPVVGGDVLLRGMSALPVLLH